MIFTLFKVAMGITFALMLVAFWAALVLAIISLVTA